MRTENMDHKLTLNRRVLLVLSLAVILTLGISPALCGWGSDPRYREAVAENFEDAQRYWPTMRHIQWSADGSQIVFVQYSQVEQKNRIYAVASDGSKVKLIFENGYHPNISPDGERIVYTATEVHRKLPFLIETRKIDGSDRQRLMEGGSEPNYLYPAWSPDGTRIALARASESGEFVEDIGIYTMAADGSDLRWPLRSGSWHVAGPVWSPDGKRLAFTGYRNEAGRLRPIPKLRHVLYALEADGSGLTRVYESPIREKHEFVNEIVGHPAWSPDGQKLAFVLNMHPEDKIADPPDVKVLTINTDGSELRTVAELPRKIISGISLSWSPDGSAILFTLSSGEIFVANADGSGHEKVGKGNYATWSPDGARIAGLGSAEPGTALYTMAPDGSDVRILVKEYEGGILGAANR